MKRQYRKWTEAQKREVVRRVLAGAKRPELQKELQTTSGLISTWMTRYGASERAKLKFGEDIEGKKYSTPDAEPTVPVTRRQVRYKLEPQNEVIGVDIDTVHRRRRGLHAPIHEAIALLKQSRDAAKNGKDEVAHALTTLALHALTGE